MTPVGKTADLLSGMQKRAAEHRRFLRGEPQQRLFVSLDPSSYAAVHAGKRGGNPTIEDQIRFHQAFPNDARVNVAIDFEEFIPQLKWERTCLEKKKDGAMLWEEKLRTPCGIKRRVVAETPGLIPWLMEPAVRSVKDFALVEFQAERIRENAALVAERMKGEPQRIREAGMLAGCVILHPFEAYWLIDYPDMPLFFLDAPEAYARILDKIQAANLELLRNLSGIGFEIFFSGSAGLELLSPAIFRKAIVPLQREFSDAARKLGVFSSYHICGHSRQLIEMGLIDAMAPTLFETCSAPPCGNNGSLHDAVHGIREDIITKGNLSLGLLAQGAPDRIRAEVRCIREATRGRRHVIGQADSTILPGTPPRHIRAFLDAVEERDA